MIEHQTTRIWTIAGSRTKYENFSNLLQGNQKNSMNYEQINESLLMQAKKSLRLKSEVYLIHDGCDIRKEHGTKMGNMTKVKSLEGAWINGYKSFDSVCISDIDTTVRLLSCSPYSYSDPNYQSICGASFNEDDIINYQIEQVDKSLKEHHSEATLWHILDRKHDDVSCFEHIDSLGSMFAIRLKMSRNSNETFENDKKKTQFVKLKDQPFEHTFTRRFDKFFYKNKLYTDCKADFSYDTLLLNEKTYWVVKVIITDRKGNNIFKQPMIIITNLNLTTDELAYKVFQIYLKRSKIEGVFKFLKEQLGWEDFQVRNFTAIQNIIAMAFFVGAYFFEIEADITKNYQFKVICQLAKCKGKYTKHFFLQGLVILAHTALFQQYVKEHNLSQQEIDHLLQFANEWKETQC